MGNKENIDIKFQEDMEFLVRYIRENSALGKFITLDDFFVEPIHFDKEKIDEALKEIKQSEEYQDINKLIGKEKEYFYSTKEMTENYAKILFQIEEKDMLRLVAETIRSDSRRFPKTTNTKVFLAEPFHLRKDEIKSILEQFKQDENYQDIQESRASNGVICLYSNQFLSKDHADALSELEEVIRVQTP